MPGLLEVFGTFFEVKIIGVGVREAWSLNWSIWANSLSAPFGIVNHLLLVNVLAIVAIPERVVAILLPPLTIKIRELGVYSWLWLWANSWNWSKGNASVFHCATKEVFSGL